MSGKKKIEMLEGRADRLIQEFGANPLKKAVEAMSDEQIAYLRTLYDTDGPEAFAAAFQEIAQL